MRFSTSIKSSGLCAFGLLAGVSTWIGAVQEDPFFWDTVQLASKHAHHFYENGLRWLPLPTELDSGHPPLLGYYLACMWRLWGKSLEVSHWSMFPFVAGVALLLWRIGYRLSGSPWKGMGLVALAAADPVIAAQSGLVGPDIALLFFFLLAVEGLWQRRWWPVTIGVLGLCALSLRGMMTAAGLMLWPLYTLWASKEWHWRCVIGAWVAFLPGWILAAGFLWWHRRAVGWTGFHPASPWAAAFEPVDAVGFLRNAVVLAWRWLDFGRLWEWIGLSVLLWRPGMRRQPAVKYWVALWACVILFLSPSALLYRNLSAHRYFMPAFAALHIVFWQSWLLSRQKGLYKWGLLAAVLLGLGTGNLWIYPHGIAMGWDATLAHRPYHALRQEAIHFIDRQGIPLSAIGTAFPNLNRGTHLLLDNDDRSWAVFDPATNTYALISNVFNDVSPEDRSLLRRRGRLLWRAEQAGVWIELYDCFN